MTVVAGIDFGTAGVRVALFDSARGRLGAGTAAIAVNRDARDPDRATQAHADHLAAMETAFAVALSDAGIDGQDVAALAVATTGSTVVPLGADVVPIDDYYFWSDHRARKEAAQITKAARAADLPALALCGGTYSSEWGLAKALHWMRANPDSQAEAATFAEHCDVMAATLCGISDPTAMPRSVCAMGHKWMWSDAHGGLPSEEFLVSVDPLFEGFREKIAGRFATSDDVAGTLSQEWADRLGLREGIPVPVGALDAHWDAIGAGCRVGDVVNVIGTSSCIMALTEDRSSIPGIPGVVPGSVHPHHVGIEAGLAAVGDIFDAIARRAGTDVAALGEQVADFRAGQTGLLRVLWDNGDRSVRADPGLAGMTLGWRLHHTAADEFFAAIEGSGFHTRIILDRLAEHGAPIARVINAGGISRRSPALNRAYASILGKPVLVPESDTTGLGSVIFAFLAAGEFDSVEQAQDALCPDYTRYEPVASDRDLYDKLFEAFARMYFINLRETFDTLENAA